MGQKKKARTINIKVVVEARLAGSSSEAKQCRQRRGGWVSWCDNPGTFLGNEIKIGGGGGGVCSM